GPRQDRRGDAQQAVLRRERARRPGVDPRLLEDGRAGAEGSRRRGARVRALRALRMTVGPEAAVRPRETGGSAFRRVLLKLSGEALMGSREYGIDVAVARGLAEEIVAVHES